MLQVRALPLEPIQFGANPNREDFLAPILLLNEVPVSRPVSVLLHAQALIKTGGCGERFQPNPAARSALDAAHVLHL